MQGFVTLFFTNFIQIGKNQTQFRHNLAALLKDK